MPVNKSESKIRVTELLGGDTFLGTMDPVVDMRVRFGADSRWIVGLDSGNLQVKLALASGGPVIAKAYPHQLIADAPDASGFGWPTATHCVPFTHHSGIRANGSPTIPHSGRVYMKGNGLTSTF